MFYIAAFLDPHTRKGLKTMMVPDQWKELHGMILGLIFGVALDKEKKSNNEDRYDNNNSNNEPTDTSSSAGLDFAFEGLYDDDDDDDDDSTTIAGTNINKKSIQIRCKHQLAVYKPFALMTMRDNEGNFNDALKYWAVNESQSPELAKLAKDFLTIPATSALSERVWSWAA